MAERHYDTFTDHRFSGEEWSAPVIGIENIAELQKRLDGFSLVGQKIKRVKITGLCCNFLYEDFSNTAYVTMEEKIPSHEERVAKAYALQIPPETLFHRSAQLDQPFLIEFEDGDVLEIELPFEYEARVGMNSMPWDIKPSYDGHNSQDALLLAPLIGRTVSRVEAKKVGEYVDVVGIVFSFDNGERLSISGDFDWFWLECLDKDGKNMTLTWEELSKAVEINR